MCGNPGVDAHHILDRSLWGDGGYYLANGATVCGPCHILAEQTLISCEALRTRCGITDIILPEHLDVDQTWDKWANPVLPDGTRLQGELFEDESLQRTLEPVLHLFEQRGKVKYPRTFHLPWSPGATNDDRVLTDLSSFEGQQVVVTTKMDGENHTFYREGLHARSLDSGPHPSRDRIKALWANVQHEIPKGWRICGENVYAKHSIQYRNLPGYFLVFSIWDEKNECLPWEETALWAGLLDLPTVPVLYQGIWDERLIRGLYQDQFEGNPMEGYVVRLAGFFPFRKFRTSVAKFVRANHVQTNKHWMTQPVIPNLLR